MSGTITLTAAMRANLLSLQQTGASLSSTQLDLATGNKVNSALDNPVNYFAAQSLNQRASQLSALLDGMGQAVSTIQSANQGITAITSLVNQLTSIVNTAKQDLSKVTTQNTLQTAGGTFGIASSVVGDLTNSALTAGSTITLATYTGNETAPVLTGDTAAFTITTGETLDQLVSQINAVTGFSASIVYGDGKTQSASSVDANGNAAGGTETVGNAYLSITTTNGQAFTASDSTGSSTDLAALGLVQDTNSNYASQSVQTGGAAADNVNYQAVLANINALAANSNYQGNNLINGTNSNLTVQINELSTTPISVSSVDSTTKGLGLTGTDITSTADITKATAAINAALSTLQTQASGFANSLSLIQNRQDFTTNLINTLQNGASSLTIADKNEEGANLLALQTQQQLGIEALSLSSQANQSVLRLFS